MSDLIYVSLIFISNLIYDINCPGKVRSFKLKVILVIRDKERPVTESLCGESASFINILFLFSKLLPVLFSPVVGLNTKVRNNKDLSSKLRLFSLF